MCDFACSLGYPTPSHQYDFTIEMEMCLKLSITEEGSISGRPLNGLCSLERDSSRGE